MPLHFSISTNYSQIIIRNQDENKRRKEQVLSSERRRGQNLSERFEGREPNLDETKIKGQKPQYF